MRTMARSAWAVLALAACTDGGGGGGDPAEDAAVDASLETGPADAAVDVAIVDAEPPPACGAQIVYTYDAPVSFRRLPAQEATRGEFESTCAAERGPERVVELVLSAPSRVEVYFESDIPLTVFVRGDCLDPASEVWCEAGLTEGPTFEMLDAGRWYLFFEPAEDGVDLPPLYVRTVSDPG